MIDCGACGARNRAGRRFCGSCGAPLAAVCPACGFANEPDERFCGGCGRSLVEIRPARGDAAPVARTAASDLSPATYTPRHLAEKILASRAGLEGERKQVTVLFADVVGSTELIRDLDTEEAQRLLDGAVERMMAAVHRYEGTVSRAMGDGVMAIFGAPIAHEDHALRACYAALAMQEAVRRYADDLRREHGREVEIRVGLNSGEVIVRLISDDLHMDYTAMGQTVHLAARMEQLARASTIRLTAQTLALVEGYAQVRALGPVPVKGLDAPIEIYQLLGAEQARTRLQAAAARGLTRFVGRDAEMATLYAALERAGAGRGQVAALVGEPGVGKSRLVWELTHSHRTEGWLVLESGSVSYGRATPWLPVIELLKTYCRIEARDDERAIREKVTGKVLTLDESLWSVQPSLFSLLDVPVDDLAWDDLDPAQRRRQTLDAVKRLLLRESQEQPLLLVFEDLHWIDAETQALLDSLVESLPTAHVLLLVNYRPEYRHEWGNKGYYAQLRIDPLGEASADELLNSLLGPDATLDPLKALLRERTEGNPLFLEESVRSLMERGVLVGERGAYRLAGSIAELRVPATVQAVLAARIDRLPPDAKGLLQVAAAIGKDVPDALLQVVAGTTEGELRRRLDALREAELLYEASLFPELEYTFKHALTHEVAYGSLLGERRRALHRRVVAAIERLYGDRLTEHVERLADHAFRAEAWEQAAAYGRQAGAKAEGRAAFREAVAACERTLAALSHLPETAETLRDGIDVRLQLRVALQPLGDRSRQAEPVAEAERLAERLGDRRRLALVYQAQGFQLIGAGELGRAVELAGRAVAIAEELGDERLLATTSFHLGLALSWRAEYHQAVRVLRQGLVTLERIGRLERLGMAAPPSMQTLEWLARCLAELGELDEAVALADAAYEVAQQDGRPYTRSVGISAMAYVAAMRGDLSTAISLYKRGIEIGQTHGVGWMLNIATGQLGWALTTSNRPAEGRPLLEQGMAWMERHGQSQVTARFRGWLARAYDAEGDSTRALELARQAVDQATARQQRGVGAWNRWHLAVILARAGDPDAERAFHEALVAAKDLGMRPLQAHCHLGLGKLYHRIGRQDEARSELETAASMLREMGMAFWLPEAEDELAAVDR